MTAAKCFCWAFVFICLFSMVTAQKLFFKPYKQIDRHQVNVLFKWVVIVIFDLPILFKIFQEI